MSEKIISFAPDETLFTAFLKIVSRPDAEGNLSGSMVVCASMLHAIVSFMIAAFGEDETHRTMTAYIDQMLSISKKN